LSFPRFPAKVTSPSDLPTFVIVHCQRVVFEFTTYAPLSEASWMEATRRSMTTGPVFRVSIGQIGQRVAALPVAAVREIIRILKRMTNRENQTGIRDRRSFSMLE